MKIYIKTYGCQMNERDSEACAGMLAERGHSIVNSEEEADVLIFNTCSVRELAERKAIGKIGIMKKLKKIKPRLIIGVMGCMVQNLGESLLKKLPHVDFLIGTGQLHKLPDILESVSADRCQTALLEESPEVLTGMATHFYGRENPIFAYVAITRGCNRYCSYCIVPYVRGREISRDIPDVVQEVKELVKSGVREIMLLGQNVAAFGLNGDTNPPQEGVSPFADLLHELNKIEGLKRIRFTSPYPSYFNDKLIDAIAALPKVCHNLHLPLQSGSNRILKKMNRHYTAEQYLTIVNKLKSRVPDMTFSTDVIVGFPDETEEDFNTTRDLMNIVDYDNAFIFKYSPRPGTPAAAWVDDVSETEKMRRNQVLLEDQDVRVLAANLRLVGTVQEVLVEGPSLRNAARWAGRSPGNKIVIFEPQPGLLAGTLARIRITRAAPQTLYGDVTV
jgi:tRNA-2-methylthio-N6-dimethylallyladenosine synthase